ncbi:DNA phosphorothioation-dependent restriction protein DptF [Staphylococcus simulans]|uniref:DNA phosphorothioation-dependent restriction protein DptF n=1 Tax=Staphylococcus simulans TaxID=1286 RepID=UPI003F806716
MVELKELEKNLFWSLRKNGIHLKATKISNVNIVDFNKEILQLKMKNSIDNTTLEIMRNIRTGIADFNKFNDTQSIQTIKNQLDRLIKYTNNKSSIASDRFKEIMKHLSVTSRESIVNSQAFTKFNEYMHIDRPIGQRLINTIKKLNEKGSGIVLLVGSVGDGKSHLLAHLNKNHPELLDGTTVYNDATESDNPYRTAQETLIEIFKKYKNEDGKIIIAINIGMLHKLTESLSEISDISYLGEIIEETNIFSESTSDLNEKDNEEVSVVSFLSEKPFEIGENGIYSDFYNQVMDKVFKKELNNPIYAAFIQDDGFNRSESLYKNYKLMLNKEVQSAVIHLLIKIQIENKRIISTRALFNFIHDIIVPDNNKENNNLLMNLLFESADRSPLLKSISSQDPSKIQNYKIDKLNVELYNALDFYGKCQHFFGDKVYSFIEEYIMLIEGLKHIRRFKMLIRLHYLFNHKDYDNQEYIEFLQLLRDVETNKASQKSILLKIQKAIYHWNGSPQTGFIYNENFEFNSKMRIGLELKYKHEYIKTTDHYTIKVGINVNGKSMEIVIDYNLYKLLCKIEKGYVLKSKDKKDAVVFSEFVENILNNLVSKDKTIVSLVESNKKFVVQKGFLGYEIKEIR